MLFACFIEKGYIKPRTISLKYLTYKKKHIMSFRYVPVLIAAFFGTVLSAQDYSPFYLGNEWIFDVLEEGTAVGIDTMRCEEVITSGDTTFYHVYNYTHYTDGRPDEDTVKLLILYEGIGDLNDVYARSFFGDTVIDFVYFKHQYTHLESYSNPFFTATSFYLGDFEIPAGIYEECFWLELDIRNSTGFALAPDIGIIAAIEEGIMTRALQKTTLANITHSELDLCEGDSVMLHSRYISEEGVYTDTLSGSGDTDSIVITTVTVFPLSETSMDVGICEGESFFAGGADQTTAGTYYDTLVSINGCDSVVITNLTVNPESESSVDVTICEGESYFAGGEEQTTSGIYYDTFTNTHGCDSVVTTNLTVEVCSGIGVSALNGEKLRVYPNPTSGMLTIETVNLKRIEVYNIFGELVKQTRYSSLDLSTLPEGCYYLKCYHSDQEVTVRKVIHQK